MSSTSSIPSNLFTGTSQFASTLSQVLTRANAIAALPVHSMQATLTDLNSRQSALQGVDSVFTALQSSVSYLQSTITGGLLSSTVSDNTVNVNVASNATAANYTILVSDMGSYSSALSNAGSTAVSDPSSGGISSTNTYTLNVNGTPIDINAADSSLNSLVTAINQTAGSQVQAAVVNVGSPSAPDYRLSLQSTELAPDTIDLTDASGSDLIARSTQGGYASYSIDGSDAVNSTSRNITIAPGVTATLRSQSTTGTAATINVSQNANTLANAFNTFAQAYNNAANTLAQYHGEGGGVLEGDSLITSLGNILQQIGNYSAGTPNTALANYGITLDQNGQLSVNTSGFTAAANSNFSGLLSVLGSTTTGGFLQTASNLLKGVEDSTSGSVKQAENSVATQITTQNSKIADAQARLTTVQQNLQAQISAADATISGLESQYSYVSGLFASLINGGSTSSSSSSGSTSAPTAPTQL
jgi:flagellar hook-associated protein 2